MTADVRGVLRSLPVSGVLWVAVLLAITGSPPFGPFLSEFTILKAVFDQGERAQGVVERELRRVVDFFPGSDSVL